MILDTIAKQLDTPAIDWKLAFYVGLTSYSLFLAWLDVRHYFVQRRPYSKLPAESKALVDEPTFARTQAYSRTKLAFSAVHSIYDLALNIGIYWYDVLPAMWSLSTRLTTASTTTWGMLARSAMFFTLLQWLATLLNLPFEAWRTFVIEEKFGFNKTTLSTFIIDIVKTMALTGVLGPPVLSAAIAIIDRYGRAFVGYLMLLLLGVNIVAVLLVPTVIQPLFNKFTPLEEGELRSGIEKLAEHLGFPMSKLYTIDGSTRSAHSNAYFTGLPFCAKRVVLYDTLVKHHSVDGVVAVVAHEFGHWRRNHMPRLLAFGMSQVLVTLLLLAVMLDNTSIYVQLGFDAAEKPVVVAFIVFMDCLTPVQAAMTFATNWFTRRCEYDADLFAVEQGYGTELAKSLARMQQTDLATVDADWLYSTYHYSHPILPERLAAIQKAEATLEKKTS